MAETIILTAGSLGSLLNNKGGYWALIAAPLLGVLAYNATNLCSTDPPAQPTISDEEYEALLQLGPWDTLTSALSKLADIVTRIVWFDMCECDSGTTPALPTDTLVPPADITIPSFGGGGSCPQPRARLDVPLFSGTVYPQWTNITRLMFPGLPIYQSVAGAVFEAQDVIAIPNHWETIQATADLVSGSAPSSPSYTTRITAFTGALVSGSAMSIVGVNDAGPHKVDPTTPVTINHDTQKYLAVNRYHPAAITVDGVVDYAITIGCSDSSSTTPGCCSDPIVVALLGLLIQQVGLIQRQQVPFAYLLGAAHPALTDSGEIAVQGLLGALVEITGGVDNVGTESGTPDQTFEAGWIAWGNADGFLLREFLSSETLISLPPLAGQFTRIGYTLPAGVTVTITELVREP